MNYIIVLTQIKLVSSAARVIVKFSSPFSSWMVPPILVLQDVFCGLLLFATIQMNSYAAVCVGEGEGVTESREMNCFGVLRSADYFANAL